MAEAGSVSGAEALLRRAMQDADVGALECEAVSEDARAIRRIIVDDEQV
jgi:hypothetical protein